MNWLSKKSSFSFSRLTGLSSLRQVEKFVFFLFFPSFWSFPFVSSFCFVFSLPFFSYFPFLFIFYLIIHRSRISFEPLLPLTTGLAVLNELFDKLLDPWVRILILSVEWGVREIEAYLCIVFNPIELIIIFLLDQDIYLWGNSHPKQ